MALDVDGFRILNTIAQSPDAFPDVRAEAAKSGRALVVKQLKAKALPLAGLRRVRDSLGAETFALIIDGLTDAEAKGLATRLDKHHPDAKTADAVWYRRRLAGLASGEEPAPKVMPPKASSKIASAKKPKVARALGSAAFSATWDGKDHDAPAAKGIRDDDVVLIFGP